MAELIPQDASGSAISTGQGQGFAQVFNKSSFDPVAFTANLNREREQKRQKEVDSAIALRAKNKKFYADLPTTDKYNEFNKDEIDKITNEAEEKLAMFMASGIDLEGSPEGQKIVRDLKNGLAMKGNQGEGIMKALDGYRGLVGKDPGKYDAEELVKWEKGLREIPTLEGRAKYVATTTPFKEQPMEYVDVLADIAKTIPLYTEEKGLQTISKWNDDVVKDLVSGYFRNLDADEVDKVYQKGVREGRWKNAQEMYDYTTEEMKNRSPYTEKYERPPSSGGGGLTINAGGGVENDKFRATPTVSPDIPGASTGNNVIHLNSTAGNEMKPMEFTIDGQPTFMKLANLQKRQGHVGKEEYQKTVAEANQLSKIKNKTPEQSARLSQLQNNLSHKERWVIKGTKAKRITGEQVNAAKKKLGNDDFFATYQEVDDEPGTYVSIIENEPIDVPISSVKGERGYENFKKIVGITGIPEKQFAEMMGEGSSPYTKSPETDDGIIDLD